MRFSSTPSMVWAWPSLANIITTLPWEVNTPHRALSVVPLILKVSTGAQGYLSDKSPYHAVLPVSIYAMKNLSINSCISCFHYSTYNYQLTTKSLLLAKHLDVSKDPYIVIFSEKQNTSILRLSCCLVWFQCI